MNADVEREEFVVALAPMTPNYSLLVQIGLEFVVIQLPGSGGD